MAIGVDFDGVLHTYHLGWCDGSVYGDLMPGALDGIKWLMDMFPVFIFTSRDPDQVHAWLNQHGLPCRVGHEGTFWNERGVLLITNHKFPAQVYLDDRALRFHDWNQALGDIKAMLAT